MRRVMEAKKVVVNDSTFSAEKPFMLRQVRAELASELLPQGALERYKIAVEDDAQLNAALDLFPQAQKLLGTASEARKNPPKP